MDQESNAFSLETMEVYLLLFLSGTSAAMFYLSLSYNQAASIFPQMTAGLVICGSVLILLNQYLPRPIQTIVMSDTDAFQRDEFNTDGVNTENSHEDKERWGWTDEHVVTAVMFFGYIFFGYLIGLLWSTPMFVYIYTNWFDQPQWVVWALVMISFGLALVFLYFLNLSLSTGYLHELVGIA